MFKDDFPKFIAEVKSFVVEPKNQQHFYENVLGWFTLMGIVGELRHPHFKKHLDDIGGTMGSNVLSTATGISKEKIAQILKAKQETPYNNDLGYVETALRVLERMEPMEFEFYVIETDAHFILLTHRVSKFGATPTLPINSSTKLFR